MQDDWRQAFGEVFLKALASAVLPGISEEQGAQMGEKLRELASAQAFPGGLRLGLTLSVAQARMEDSQESFVARLKTALDQAKQSGGNAVARG